MKEFIDKLISRLREENQKWLGIWQKASLEGKLDNYADGMSDAFDESIEIANQLVEEYNNGWIPCSERLPKVEGWYIITIESNGKYRVENDLYAVETAEYNGHEHGFCKGRHRKIIAWQPLPEPYKPKE